MKLRAKLLNTIVFWCTISMMFLTSCTDNQDNLVTPQSEEELADVAILFYGLGGGNLDNAIIQNIRQFYWANTSSYDNVKIAVEYKFSSKEDLPRYENEAEKDSLLKIIEQVGEETFEKEVDGDKYICWMDPEGFSTFRFVLDPNQTLHQQAAANYLPQDNCDFCTPDSLTNFINWAAKQCPAKKYVLLLSDHGGGFFPPDEVDEPASTRSVLFDTGHNNKCFSAQKLASAIAAANIRPDVIYYDACLMNTIEYQFELKDVTNYIVASTYTVPGPGGIYDALVDCLAGASNNMEYALEKYIEYANKNWDKILGYELIYNDITVTSTATLDHLGELMREFVDRLCDTYKNGTEDQRQRIDNVTKHAVKVSSGTPFYDIAKYISSMMRSLPEVYDNDFYEKFKEAFNSGLVAQYTSQYLLDHNYQVDYSVVLGANGHFTYAWTDLVYDEVKNEILCNLTNLRYYEPDGTTVTYDVNNGLFSTEGESDYTLGNSFTGTWGGTLDSTYGQTTFDRIVGWSRWLRLNQQEPPIWSRNGSYAALPDGDLIENPTI